jgi:hypothetical protein
VPMEGGFTPDHPLPLERGERGLLLLLNAIILVITTILIGIAITLSSGNLVKVFGDEASLTDNSAPKPLSVQSTPTIQSAADAQALPPAARGDPRRSRYRDRRSEPGRHQRGSI